MHQPTAPRRAPVNTPAVKQESRLSYWKRVFHVDQTVFEERDIVRVNGSYDYVFLILVLILLAFGTIMVYSASYAYAKQKYNDSY